MKAKKYFVVTLVMSVVLLTLAASFWQAKRAGDEFSEPGRMALTGPTGKFGPIIESVLPALETNGVTDILNLETGRMLAQPLLDVNSSADTIMAGIRSNGLNLSCYVWTSGAACITYDMTIVAAEGKPWQQITEEELLGNPALTPRQHTPRRLLLVQTNNPKTYFFRTGEGTLGMFRIAGQSAQGVKICYKLINPANSPAVHTTIASNITNP